MPKDVGHHSLSLRHERAKVLQKNMLVAVNDCIVCLVAFAASFDAVGSDYIGYLPPMEFILNS